MGVLLALTRHEERGGEVDKRRTPGSVGLSRHESMTIGEAIREQER